MEAAVGTVAGKIAPKLLDFLTENHKLRRELEHDIKYIKSEFVMISAAIREDSVRPPWSGNEVHKAWIKMVRQLAHDIEDCIDRFTRRVMLDTVDASWIRRKFHHVKTMRARSKFASAIRRLKKTSEEASKLRTTYSTNHGGGGGSNTSESRPFDEEMPTDTSVAAVGMVAPQDEIMELIRETQQPKELKVISLVGFGGIGKTLLARHVYDTTESKYEARAWVRAAEKGAGDILEEILRQLGSAGTSCRLSNSKLCANLKEFLGRKRFFIVIDDMRTVLWHDIKDAFPVVQGVCSRVMVTTAIQSVAKACSSAHGHAYVMRTLAKEHSRQLFFQEASLEDLQPSDDHTQIGTSEALTKCDGLPLALVTTAQFLQSRGDPNNWGNLCENLGEHLETENTLASMNRVLVRSYTSLGSQDVKTCLLYLGIYPSGHPIRRGSLIRRWIAEGIIKEDNKRSAVSVAFDNFNELVDRSIIQPMDDSSTNSAGVKTCQTHGMMLEFILHKSMCENFVTLLCDKDPLPGSNIRWLSLQHKSAARSKMNPKDLRLVRSLTVFGKAHTSVLNFPKYELLRVLDLEECDDQLEDKHLKEICSNLLLLRYLSLGAALTVTTLPKEIKKLQFLETLDIRRTNLEILPTQVIELPCLVHLLGKFKLQQKLGSRRMRKIQTWLSKHSKLETVAGFVVDKGQEFPQLMDHMEHLTKVKIWCESTADGTSNSSHLSEAIKGFIKRGTDLKGSRSLSLNFREWSQDLLNFTLEKDYPYYLCSLKLQGNNICSLPPFVTILGGVTKLCLSSPQNKLSEDVLAALSRVHGLEYLKLIATRLDKLVIGSGSFRSLRRLCIVVDIMTELEIQEGALLRLEALQLLCKDINIFCGAPRIQSMGRLKEVTLHKGINDETQQEWKEAAKNHPRHPKLLFVETKLLRSQPRVEIILAATTAKEVDVGSEPAAEISLAVPTDETFEDIAVEREPSVEIINVTPPTDMTDKEVDVESELAEEISPTAAATDMTTEEVDVESEPVGKINPTSSTLSATTSPNDISTGESVQIDGGGQHDDNVDEDDSEKEDMDQSKDPKDFPEKKGLQGQNINQMNKQRSIEVT